jgi:hypothetical protein
MSVGQELLNVPFPQMVRSLAMAIADGQRALDKSSVETARLLAQEKISLIEEIHEVIKPAFDEVELDSGETIRITGATVDAKSTPPKPYSLMQAGLFPTFYQFTESIIEVKMAISSRTSSTREFEAGAELGINYGPVSFAAHVNFKTSQTYSYSAEGSSLLRTTLKPVPPPARINPRIITVNTLPILLGQPPTVTTG